MEAKYSSLSPAEYDKEISILNDIVIKSIRNYSITERWRNASII